MISFRAPVSAAWLTLLLSASLAQAANAQEGAMAEGEAKQSRSPALSCEALLQRGSTQVRITSATPVAAGPFALPAAGPGRAPDSVSLPSFCRVSATLAPTTDSDIKMELWLPQDGWNGKFMMVGNGGWSGSIVYAAMAEPLRRGYAVTSTNTGHDGARGTFGYGHPEKLVDFAWRAVHLTTIEGKALTTAYYGGAPRYAYWNGCSSGGKQGLKELQRFPTDYDGAIVGAPANNWMRLQAQSLNANIANIPRGGEPILGPPQFALLHQGVLDQCDAQDGLKDRQVQDPRTCRFRATSLICKPGQDPAACLTPLQARTADILYAAVRDPATHALIYPGMPPGSELTWGPVVSRRWDTGADTYGLAHNDPNWDFYTLNLSQDVAAAEAWDPGIMATTPDLSAFKARGGKVIQYHGWADPFIPTENSINYYESVIAEQGGLTHTQEFYRLFLVPAMGHCGGAYAIDWITPLEHWVEADHAPDLVLGQLLPAASSTMPVGAAETPPNAPTRMICAYPKIARLQHGDGSEPGDWSCRTGTRGARPDDSSNSPARPAS